MSKYENHKIDIFMIWFFLYLFIYLLIYLARDSSVDSELKLRDKEFILRCLV